MCEFGCPAVTEEWRSVVGYEKLYEVSNLGRVRSLDRVVECRDGRVLKFKGQLLNLIDEPGAYAQVGLSYRGRKKTRRVHQLLLEAFVGPAPEGQESLHSDDRKRHNCLSNLRYGTRSENQFDCVRNGNNPNANKLECHHGHLLSAPNLSAAGIRAGFRSCLACCRMRSRFEHAKRRGVDPGGTRKQVADAYFAQIMESAA